MFYAIKNRAHVWRGVVCPPVAQETSTISAFLLSVSLFLGGSALSSVTSTSRLEVVGFWITHLTPGGSPSPLNSSTSFLETYLVEMQNSCRVWVITR